MTISSSQDNEQVNSNVDPADMYEHVLSSDTERPTGKTLPRILQKQPMETTSPLDSALQRASSAITHVQRQILVGEEFYLDQTSVHGSNLYKGWETYIDARLNSEFYNKRNMTLDQRWFSQSCPQWTRFAQQNVPPKLSRVRPEQVAKRPRVQAPPSQQQHQRKVEPAKSKIEATQRLELPKKRPDPPKVVAGLEVMSDKSLKKEAAEAIAQAKQLEAEKQKTKKEDPPETNEGKEESTETTPNNEDKKDGDPEEPATTPTRQSRSSTTPAKQQPRRAKRKRSTRG